MMLYCPAFFVRLADESFAVFFGGTDLLVETAAKYSRTLAASCRSVILSAVSSSTVTPRSFLLLMRLLNSPLA